MDKINIFQPTFHDPELSQAFEDFFILNDLLPLFTHENRVTKISYTYANALSVVNIKELDENDKNNDKYNKRFVGARKTGANREILQAYSNVIHLAIDNKKYEESLVKTIDVPMTFQSFMNIIKRQLQHIYGEIDNDYMKNMWNIVWYADHENGVKIW